MQKLTGATVISTTLVALASGYAQAATFTEIGDVGETLETAQTIQGSRPLESISGALSQKTSDADLFKVFLTGDQKFSATTISSETLVDLPIDQQLGVPTELLRNPQLFLFNSDGRLK